MGPCESPPGGASARAARGSAAPYDAAGAAGGGPGSRSLNGGY